MKQEARGNQRNRRNTHFEVSKIFQQIRTGLQLLLQHLHALLERLLLGVKLGLQGLQVGLRHEDQRGYDNKLAKHVGIAELKNE